MAINRRNFIKAGATTVTMASLAGCSAGRALLNNDSDKPVKVAFIADAHFHDVYGSFSDGSFKGLPNSISGQNATIRSMYAQLTSTRLFNENYFALIEALDDMVERDIKFVALTGDFSDDGQPVHMRGLQRILDEYTEKHGIQFFSACGNHDPVRPFNASGGKNDYLGEGGMEQPIFTSNHANSQGHDHPHRLPTVVTGEVAHDGYEAMMTSLENHGFYPKPEYLYFATPFSNYTPDHYSFDLAREQAQFGHRFHEICHEGTGGKYKKAHYTNGISMPDTSYLVEPVEGLWLLSIDSNVYTPKAELENTEDLTDFRNFDGSGNAGFTKVLTHKAFLIDWIRGVAKQAELHGKTLVAFSHYPTVEFFNGASDDIEDIFGEGRFDLGRVPEEQVAKVLADAGLRLHFGGHMHFNDTGLRQFGSNEFMLNMQVPSLAAYIPGYKVLTVDEGEQMEVETIALRDVKRFDELFEHYREEHAYLKEHDPERLWDESILNVKNYHEFTSQHISELTRLRFLPGDWPCDLREMLYSMNGKDMLVLSQLETDITLETLKQAYTGSASSDVCEFMASHRGTAEIPAELLPAWEKAETKAAAMALAAGFTLNAMTQWNGFNLASDFYRLRSADEMAMDDIHSEHIPQYVLLAKSLAENSEHIHLRENSAEDRVVGDLFKTRFGSLFNIMAKFASGEPSRHFTVNMKSGDLTRLA